MIGVPMPNPRDAIVAELGRQMDAFFGSGGSAQQIAQSVSGETNGYGPSSHQEHLRAERKRLVP